MNETNFHMVTQHDGTYRCYCDRGEDHKGNLPKPINWGAPAWAGEIDPKVPENLHQMSPEEAWNAALDAAGEVAGWSAFWDDSQSADFEFLRVPLTPTMRNMFPGEQRHSRTEAE